MVSSFSVCRKYPIPPNARDTLRLVRSSAALFQQSDAVATGGYHAPARLQTRGLEVIALLGGLAHRRSRIPQPKYKANTPNVSMNLCAGTLVHNTRPDKWKSQTPPESVPHGIGVVVSEPAQRAGDKLRAPKATAGFTD
jgi:hypothetical protein